MRILSKTHPFHRHEMVDLGAILLASFRQRLNAFALDCFVVFLPWFFVVAMHGYHRGRHASLPAWLPSRDSIHWITLGLFLGYMTLATYFTQGRRWASDGSGSASSRCSRRA
jgi:hypothetical protein